MSNVINADRRITPRYDMATDGQVVMMSGARVPFKIVNISQRGAQLRLEKMVVLNSEFMVDVFSPCRTKVKRCDARRTWQKHGLVGVKFITSRVIDLDQYAA